ncbi:MAG: hypothetical protein H7175_10550, partial [Burkholderiales bacterium]|nr:hypothetical protein [Anaerolineae bacterium]
YPHHKVCGEFLSPECTPILDTLGMTAALNDLHPITIDTICLTAPDGTTWQTALPGALGLSRYALDHALAKQAAVLGVDVREATNVTNIAGSFSKGFDVQTRSETVRARTVIATHGKRGALDRTLNRRFLRQQQPFVGLKAHFHGPPIPNRIELHAFPGGYCGLSETESGAANVCLLVRESVFQAHDGIATFIDWMAGQNPRLGAWLSQAESISERWLSIAQVPFVNKQAVENDVLMAGDSAGLIVPLAGDGIAMALRAGSLAAAHVADYVAEQISADDLRRSYTTAWRGEFTTRLRLARVLQTIVLRPSLLAMGLRLLNAVPALGDFIVTHTREKRITSIRKTHPSSLRINLTPSGPFPASEEGEQSPSPLAGRDLGRG